MKAADIDYCITHTTTETAVLSQLDRETNLKTLSPQMQSGSYQGVLLKFISQMINPQRILEIGTFSGYSAICLADGLSEDGVLHTIEVNDELAWLIQKYVQLSGFEDKIVLHIGDAKSIIPKLDEIFDLVFIDAGKLEYTTHFEMVLPKVRSGGFILVDNVLWDGKVAGGDQKDETAVSLRAFNDHVHQDDRVENLLLPLRDGLMLIRKK
ncbi:MAG: class I SAM-dependent methyltransferase [Lewinellaceae bacterium]|nr:class I SAM-dependent methyltransferase [Saprospiraceae bacterium]MCB9344933.1 class I SAM-dependent methyltransferase [Lewinellaceae bacterium]